LRRISIQSVLVIAAASVLPCALVLAQTRPAESEPIPFGSEGFSIPPSLISPATPPRVVELLVQALAANPVAQRRVELLRDLGECRLPEAVPTVIAAMSDPDPAVRSEAARAAAVLGDASAVAPLQKLLADAEPSVRVEAIRAGTSLKDPSIVSAGLKDTNDLCFAAACALASTAEHDALIATRLPLVSAASKRIAVRALGRRAASAHVEVVAAQLTSTDVTLLTESINALTQMKAAVEISSIRKLLAHEHPSVRRAAVRAMASLAGADEQIAVARQMLGDADLTVRQAGAELLVAHPSPDTVPTLVQQLSAGYEPLREISRNALAAASTLARDAVTEFAVKLLDDVNPARRIDGSTILGQIKSDAAFDRHVKLLSDPDWTVVEVAAESLGNIGRGEAGVELMKIVSRAQGGQSREPNETEAIAATFIACGKLQHKPALAIARQLIPQKLTAPPILRTRAIWAAGVLGDAGDRELAGAFRSVANDNSPFEVEEARFEAIKAIGNLGYKTAIDELRRYEKSQQVSSLRWMAHTVIDRLAGGTATPYTPPTDAIIADTSIQDISP